MVISPYALKLPDTDKQTELCLFQMVGGILHGETRALHPELTYFKARDNRGTTSVYRKRRDGTFCAIVP